ncbi:MAG: hypothetical protein IJ262_10530 [Clostridia bacterium]|nr:hypothetical protein [Clostridia bacterium]MBQ8029824.1 hypothetical protein [Clostridia bacterium]
MTEDSIHLLKECDSGTKTAVNSIREVLDNVKSEKLLDILTASLQAHEALGDEANELLEKEGESGKEPNPMARAMSWLKINTHLMGDNSDQTIAHLMTDGCNMGIKQISIYKNKYPTADKAAERLADRLIKEEQKLIKDLMEFM